MHRTITLGLRPAITTLADRGDTLADTSSVERFRTLANVVALGARDDPSLLAAHGGHL